MLVGELHFKNWNDTQIYQFRQCFHFNINFFNINKLVWWKLMFKLKMQAITVVPYHPSNLAVYPFGHDLSLCLAEPFLSLFYEKIYLLWLGTNWMTMFIWFYWKLTVFCIFLEYISWFTRKVIFWYEIFFHITKKYIKLIFLVE